MWFNRRPHVCEEDFRNALLLIAKMKTTAERRLISNEHALDDLIYMVRYYLKTHPKKGE